MIDYKYHLIKLILIRSLYHNYLKRNTLIGEQMSDLFKLTEINICLNRGIIYQEKESRQDIDAKTYMIDKLNSKFGTEDGDIAHIYHEI